MRRSSSVAVPARRLLAATGLHTYQHRLQQAQMTLLFGEMASATPSTSSVVVEHVRTLAVSSLAHSTGVIRPGRPGLRALLERGRGGIRMSGLSPEMAAALTGTGGGRAARFGRGDRFTATSQELDDASRISPIIFERRTPEERRRDERGVQKILEVAKGRAEQGERKVSWWLRLMGYNRRYLRTLRFGSTLYANVFYQSLKEEFYELLGYQDKELLPWFLISTLHVWMTSVRLRKIHTSLTYDVRVWFADTFWVDVEEKLVENVGVNHVGLDKGFKTLATLYGNATFALDKALKSGSDEQLGDALFRHIFFNRLPHQSHMDVMIKYVQQELARLDMIDNNLILHGYLPWGDLPSLPKQAQSPQDTTTTEAKSAAQDASASSS